MVRPIRIDGDIAYVTLTKGYQAVIDAADVHLVEAFNWTALVQKNRVYACRTAAQENGKIKSFRLHRVIMCEPDGMEVDHIDGDGLNNRRSNLRESTRSENARNRGATAANTSGFKGVSWHKRNKKWVAHIRLSGVKKNLGSFDDIEDARKAYASVVFDVHGKFARLA